MAKRSISNADDTTIRATNPVEHRSRSWQQHVLHCPEHERDGEVLPLRGRSITVGRGDNARVRFADSQMSRIHAIINCAGEQMTVEDTSTNGTFVNGERVELQPLQDGDVVRMGNTFLLIRAQLDGDSPTSAGGNRDATNSPAAVAGVDPLIGTSPQMQQLRSAIARVAHHSAAVLVMGETGTGKELVARGIHALSGRRGPLIAVNCSALPNALAESELFGHVKGAFSGATTAQQGYFRAADGGVLFLDEVGEMEAAIQPKLLRALETGTITPVGSTQSVSCNVRVIAATNRDLRGEAERGVFRSDLYARLSQLVLTTAPLRERREDILPILLSFLQLDADRLAPDLVHALLSHAWPFNVRELLSVGRQLQLNDAARYRLSHAGQHLQPPHRQSPHRQRDPAPPVPEQAAQPPPSPPKPVPAREELVEALREHRGIIANVARAMGRSRRQVYRWLDTYGLDREDFR